MMTLPRRGRVRVRSMHKGAVRKRSVIANQRARWCGTPRVFPSGTIPRIFKHLGRKTKLFPSNRGAATPVTSVTGSQRHTFLTAPFLAFVSYSFFSGSWLITTAAKTSTQPSSSALVMVSWSSSQPKRAAKTDSRLMSRAAALGATRFWPTICRV